MSTTTANGYTVYPTPTKLPALTHAEAIDYFPILRGLRAGFCEFRTFSRLGDNGLFMDAATANGAGGYAAGRLVCSLLNYGTVDIRYCLEKLDGEHRKAFADLCAAVAERGIQ